MTKKPRLREVECLPSDVQRAERKRGPQTQTLDTVPPSRPGVLPSRDYSRRDIWLFCFIINFYTPVLDMFIDLLDWSTLISLAFIFVCKAAVAQG